MNAVLVFHNLLVASGLPIVGVSGSVVTQGQKPADLRIDFIPAATDAQRAQGQSLADSFNWLDIPPMDVAGLDYAIFHDSLLPASTKISIAPFVQMLYTHADVADRQAFWAALKAEHEASGDFLSGNCTDGATSVASRIETLAAQFQCALV